VNQAAELPRFSVVIAVTVHPLQGIINMQVLEHAPHREEVLLGEGVDAGVPETTCHATFSHCLPSPVIRQVIPRVVLVDHDDHVEVGPSQVGASLRRGDGRIILEQTASR
jgi:hypothetical protein